MKRNKICMSLCLILLLSGCGNLTDSNRQTVAQEETPQAEVVWTVNGLQAKESFELTELTEMYPFIMKGTCLSLASEKDALPSYQIEVEKQFQGSQLEKTITVSTDGKDLEPAKTYYFMLAGIESVYTETLTYQAGLVLAVDSAQKVHVENIKGSSLLTAEKWEEALKGAVADHPYSRGTEYIGSYLHSDDLKEIYEYAGTAVLIEPFEYIELGVTDRENYRCRVISALKGTASDVIWAVFKPGTVKIGEQYLALLVRDNGGSVYTLAAPGAVFPGSGSEAEQIRKLAE